MCSVQLAAVHGLKKFLLSELRPVLLILKEEGSAPSPFPVFPQQLVGTEVTT